MNVVKYQNINTTIKYNAEKILTIKNFIFNEFIHGGHLIALGTAGIALSSMFLFNSIIRWEFLLIIYLGTLCIYSYDYYKELEIDSLNNSNRTDHLKKYHNMRPLAFISYGVGFFILVLYFGNFESIIFGVLLLIAGLLYTSKFKQLTKRIIGFKSFYTAFSFSLLIIFTAIYCTYPINWLLFIFCAFVFLNIMIITSFCDIKDIDTDRKQNLLTLPIFFGKRKFLLFLHILNFISFALIIIAIITQVIPLFSIFLFLSYLYCFYYIQKAKDDKTDLHTLTNVMVDAEYFFWPFFLFLGKFFMTVL